MSGFYHFSFVLALTGFMSYLNGVIAEVHNTKKEIDTCMGKVQLTLLCTWGGDEEEDENKFFKFPWDIVIDKKGTVYICDEGNHRIQVFDESGKTIKIEGKKYVPSASSLALDARGRIYIVGGKRHPTEKEASYFQETGIRSQGGGISLKVPAVENTNTDLYRLIVFDSSGKIFGAAQLNVFLDKIYVHGDRLFIIDTFKAMKIYEYKIDFR